MEGNKERASLIRCICSLAGVNTGVHVVYKYCTLMLQEVLLTWDSVPSLHTGLLCASVTDWCHGQWGRIDDDVQEKIKLLQMSCANQSCDVNPSVAGLYLAGGTVLCSIGCGMVDWGVVYILLDNSSL